ncbi:VanZ family protein, partial [bacterium]|nr:VanZ family protein [bacterium]
MASNGRPNIAHIAPDWILHIMAYSILGLLAWIAWLGILRAATRNIGITLSIATPTLFSLLAEGRQVLTPTSTAQISDLAAGFIGAITRLFLITL